MLRRALIIYGVLAVAGGLVLLALGAGFTIVFYLLGNGVVILAALLFERSRYRPDRPAGARWESTGERFVDPTTGHQMEVRYDRQTGARDYVDLGPPAGTA